MVHVFSLDARTADEGRSFFSKPGGGNRLGEKLFADGVTLRSDPFDPRNPGTPWAPDGFRFGGRVRDGGLPARKTTWIEDGVVKTLAVDRYWASKTKVEPVPLSGGMTHGRLGQVARRPDRRDRARLARHPVLVHPLRSTPRPPCVTGLTRDGVWLIEKGKVVHPVNNFRFNDSPVNLLKNLEATSVADPGRQRVLPA